MLNRTKAPTAYDIQGITLLHPQKLNLDNGLPVWTFHAPDQPLVKLEFVFQNLFRKTGEDPLQNMTLSALMREGTSTMSSVQIAEAVDYYGAFLVPEFSFDCTSYTLYTLNKHLPAILPILQHIFLDAQLPEEELATYQRNSRQSLQISLEKTDMVAKRLFYETLFGRNRYGTTSTDASLAALQRDELLELLHAQIRPENCTLFLSGNITQDVITAINQYFGKNWQAKPYKSGLFVEQENFPGFQAFETDLIFQPKPGAVQSAIRLGRRGLQRTHPDFPAYQFVNTLFGGYFGSRLMRNIREDKGYTYGIGSSVVNFKHVGMQVIATQVGADVTRNTLDEIQKEMNILSSILVDESEIVLVRNYVLGSMLGSLESVFSHADKFKAVYFSGMDLEYYAYYTEVVKQIDARQIRRIAEEHFQYENMVKVVVGKM